MSLTSYRAAPPRDGDCPPGAGRIERFAPRRGRPRESEWVFMRPSASMPGDALLFQRLSVSTIGADWFHGRVREGIGWVTDAMVTKQ